VLAAGYPDQDAVALVNHLVVPQSTAHLTI
jgi:hypothetical protein